MTDSAHHPRKTPALRLALAVYWLILIAVTHLPQIDEHSVPEWELLPFDKTMHFLTFGGLAGWLCWNRFLKSRGAWPNAVLAVVVGAVYGASKEISQPWFGRVRDVGDFAADLLGLFVGATIAALLWRWIWPAPAGDPLRPEGGDALREEEP